VVGLLVGLSARTSATTAGLLASTFGTAVFWVCCRQSRCSDFAPPTHFSLQIRILYCAPAFFTTVGADANSIKLIALLTASTCPVPLDPSGYVARCCAYRAAPKSSQL
ncbi:hypothetical protein CSUI_000237, partial [Cystoisospora suis]